MGVWVHWKGRRYYEAETLNSRGLLLTKTEYDVARNRWNDMVEEFMVFR